MRIIKQDKFKVPKISFTEQAYLKILQIIFATDLEIAWHGTVQVVDDLEYVITDVLLYPQSATSTTVESDDDDYPSWLHNLDDETFNSIRMQGHSHVDMGVAPSQVDIMNQEDIMSQVKDYYIFMIINRREDLTISLVDMKQGIMYENDDIDVYLPDTWAQKAVNKYLKKKKYKYQRATTKATTKTKVAVSKHTAFDKMSAEEKAFWDGMGGNPHGY